jgi:hypothetical protein
MCPSVATDQHTGERANTGCLGGRIMISRYTGEYYSAS